MERLLENFLQLEKQLQAKELCNQWTSESIHWAKLKLPLNFLSIQQEGGKRKFLGENFHMNNASTQF